MVDDEDLARIFGEDLARIFGEDSAKDLERVLVERVLVEGSISREIRERIFTILFAKKQKKKKSKNSEKSFPNFPNFLEREGMMIRRG